MSESTFSCARPRPASCVLRGIENIDEERAPDPAALELRGHGEHRDVRGRLVSPSARQCDSHDVAGALSDTAERRIEVVRAQVVLLERREVAGRSTPKRGGVNVVDAPAVALDVERAERDTGEIAAPRK